VTYDGSAQWYEHEPWYGDDDYNIYITRDDQSGYTQDNTNGVLTEFDSQETINYFITPWWTAFHTAVDHSDADAEYMLTLLGQPAYIIEVGVMGLDCAHYCSSEIHPTYALAVHVKNEPSDDEWAIFGRNWGDEGFCSLGEVVDSDLTKIYLTLPWYPGAADTAPVVTDQTVWEEIGAGIQVTTFPQFTQFGSVRHGTGFVVELDLGDAGSEPLVSGELHLKWNTEAGTTSAQAVRAKEIAGAKKNGQLGAAVLKPEPEEAEEAFAKYVAGLPPETGRKIKEALVHAHPSRPSTELHATNLREAPAGFQAHPPRYDASGKGALTNIKIVADPAKTKAVEKIKTILREANAPDPPER
jgi:hypothetical protein